MENNYKYTMKLSLNVLKHLGLNLYSNIPAVLSEVVANSYDADADSVSVEIKDDMIVIKDDGHGMSIEDINEKFLVVGYSRRDNNEAISPKYKRPVMGRKGIGKLSLFSIASNIEIHSVKNGIPHGFVMNSKDIEKEIKNNEEYHPKDVPSSNFSIDKGTRIIISDFKKKINYTESYLKKRIARRFSVIGSKYNFTVSVNNTEIGASDRDYFSKIQFIWLVGDSDHDFSNEYSFEKVNKLNGSIDSPSGYSISGWIGAVSKPSDLEQDGVNNNKISIICRGKMAQEDILETYNEGGIYATYLIGEIHSDFLDDDKLEDIATSSRQKINEDDPRYRELEAHVYKILKQIQNVWTNYRIEISERDAVKNATEINPALSSWFESLKTDTRKEHAKKLFATIESLHFDKHEERDKKRELYKQGILAFEKLKLRDSLNQLDKIQSADDIRLAAIFTDLTDLEANLYYDIAYERVAVIKEFQKQLDANDKEKLLQKYLFDNLWLLNPSWERPTEGTEIMEQKVEKEFGEVINSLSDDERKGRMDIKYRTAAGKHIIIELKRYMPSYNITPVMLYEQVKKYRSALEKCILATEGDNPPIEIIVVLGHPLESEDYQEARDLLRRVQGRIIYYDSLIADSLKSYSDYLDKQKEISRIRSIIEKV
jgi:hypothetical protein